MEVLSQHSDGEDSLFSRTPSVTSQSRTLTAVRRAVGMRDTGKQANETGILANLMKPIEWATAQIEDEVRMFRTLGFSRAAEELIFKTISYGPDKDGFDEVSHSHSKLEKIDSFGRTIAHTAALQDKVQQLESLYIIAPEMSESRTWPCPKNVCISVSVMWWSIAQTAIHQHKLQYVSLFPRNTAHMMVSYIMCFVWSSAIMKSSYSHPSNTEKNGCKLMYGRVSVVKEDLNGCMPAHCAAMAGHITVLQWIQQKDESLLFKPNGGSTQNCIIPSRFLSLSLSAPLCRLM